MNLRETLDGKLLPLLDAVLADSMHLTAEVRFDKEHSQQLTLMCLYCTVVELAHSERALIDKGQTTALPIVLRSIFEAYADLRALLSDAAYAKRMYATFLQEKVRFLKNVLRTPSNPFLVGVRSEMAVEQEIGQLEAEIAELEKEGKKPLSNFSRFDAAKLEHEYQSIYWLLCLEGHNNMSALDDRHIEKRGEEYDVVLFKEADPKDLVRIVDALLAVLTDCGIRVHKVLNSEAVKLFEGHQRTLNIHRGDYSKVHQQHSE
jgi:hypothetical protein